jgi:hypothetical protein
MKSCVPGSVGVDRKHDTLHRALDEGVELSGDAHGVSGAVGVGALLAPLAQVGAQRRFASAMASGMVRLYSRCPLRDVPRSETRAR